MMRVSYYLRYPSGGSISIERLFIDICRALPQDIIQNIFISRFLSRGVFKRIYNIVEASFRQGDVNHITGDVHYLAFLLKKKKTILTIHDLVSVHRFNGVRRFIYLLFWYWLPIKRACIITVVSESTKKELLKSIKVNPDKIRVVHNCVSDDFQKKDKIFNKEKPVILQVGTADNKNIERVIYAIKGISCHFRIIGKLEDKYMDLLRKTNIDYSSASGLSDKDMVDEYAFCDIVVFVSLYEGFGLPIIEANATGRPVVTSNIYSMPEVAADAACIVDPFDIKSIRCGINKIINEEEYRTELINNGYRNVRRFESKEVANKYVEIYREIIGDNFKRCVV